MKMTSRDRDDLTCRGEDTSSFWRASLDASWRGARLSENQDLSRLDWPWLLRAGLYHRVLADLLYVWSDLRGLPPVVQEKLWVSQQMAQHRGTMVQQGIRDLQQIAGPKHVRLAVLKSPTYVVEAFGGFDRREVQDIDLLVSPQDVPVLTRGLMGLGYGAERRTRRHKGQEHLLVKQRLLVEVHETASNRRRFQRLLRTEDLLQRAVVMESHPPLLRLCDADEALVMVLHAYHHGWREALWIRDLAAWWRVRRPDPEAILKTFRAAGLARTGWTAWRGMSMIGWDLPATWSPHVWKAGASFDRQVTAFWQQCLNQVGESRQQWLRRRWLEVIQAQGWQSRLSALTPVFSWRSMTEFCRPRAGPCQSASE